MLACCPPRPAPVAPHPGLIAGGKGAEGGLEDTVQEVREELWRGVEGREAGEAEGRWGGVGEALSPAPRLPVRSGRTVPSRKGLAAAWLRTGQELVEITPRGEIYEAKQKRMFQAGLCSSHGSAWLGASEAADPLGRQLAAPWSLSVP